MKGGDYMGKTVKVVGVILAVVGACAAALYAVNVWINKKDED